MAAPFELFVMGIWIRGIHAKMIEYERKCGENDRMGAIHVLEKKKNGQKEKLKIRSSNVIHFHGPLQLPLPTWISSSPTCVFLSIPA